MKWFYKKGHIKPYHYETIMYFKFLHDKKTIPTQTKVHKVVAEFLDNISFY